MRQKNIEEITGIADFYQSMLKPQNHNATKFSKSQVKIHNRIKSAPSEVINKDLDVAEREVKLGMNQLLQEYRSGGKKGPLIATLVAPIVHKHGQEALTHFGKAIFHTVKGKFYQEESADKHHVGVVGDHSDDYGNMGPNDFA